jgi:hypothetical protein
VAQTKKKRRRKHRGTQGGRVDSRPKGRPQNRAEARQRAKQKRASGGGSKRSAARERPLTPPSWPSAIRKALVAGVIFFVLLAVAFQRPMGASAALAATMLIFYIPMAYYTDKFFFNRRIAELQKERSGE